jgi:copper chaperone CopZ
MIRFFYVLLFSLAALTSARGQYQRVEIGIDGFTCSMCGMSVENAIRKLPFVSDVEMDLNKNTAVVFFRSNREISILQVAEQVYASGFSIRSFQANYQFPSLTLQDHFVFQAGKEEFHFLNTGDMNINGLTTIIFLNKKLISRKDYSLWEEWIKKDVKKNGKKDNALYVTLKRG